MQGALQRAIADNPDLVQQDPALLKLANKVIVVDVRHICPYC